MHVDEPHGFFGKERKGKEAYLYSAFYILCISQSAQAWITQFYMQIHHALPFFRNHSPDGATPKCHLGVAPSGEWLRRKGRHGVFA